MTGRRRERTVFDGIGPSEKLSPRTVDVCPALILAWEEDLARRDDEIAEMTGMAVGSSKAQLHRARKLVQEVMKDSENI